MATSVSSSDFTRMHAIIWELFNRTNVFLSSFKSLSSLWDDESTALFFEFIFERKYMGQQI